jgi:hypothetical protein
MKIGAGKREKIIKNPRDLHNDYLRKIRPENTISCGFMLDQAEYIVCSLFIQNSLF